MSGADLEYQRMLAEANATYADKLDAARLEQLGDVAATTSIRNMQLPALLSSVAGEINIPASEIGTALAASLVAHAGNGTPDDTSRINSLLSAKSHVKGKPGETYTISAPLVIPSDTTLDMTGCVVNWKTGVAGGLMLHNAAFTPVRVVSDIAITIGTTAAASAGTPFTGADVGRTLSIDGASETSVGTFTTNIISVASGIATLSAPAKRTVAAAKGRVYNRDKNLHAKGGTWNRGTAVGVFDASLGNGGLLGYMNTAFIHVDDFTVDLEKITSSDGVTKYAVYLADVTGFDVAVHDLDVASDGVHITGPAARGHVSYLAGRTGDDFLAFTGADYPMYGATGGDITDITWGTLLLHDADSGLCFVPGAGNRIDRIKGGFIGGHSLGNGARLIQDFLYTSLAGGTMGDIDLGTIAVTAVGVCVLFDYPADTDRVTAKVIGTATSGQLVKVNSNPSATVPNTIKNLVLNDCNVPTGHTLLTVASPLTTIQTLHINRVASTGNALIINGITGTIGMARVKDSRIVYTDTLAPFYGIGFPIGHLVLVDCVTDVSGGTLGITVHSLACLKITARGGSHTGKTAAGAIIFNPGACTIILDNTQIVAARRAIAASAALTVYLTNAIIESLLDAIYTSAGGATIIGSLAALTGGGVRILDPSSGGTLRVNGPTLPVQLSGLTALEGDMARNVSAAAASGWYVGPVIKDLDADVSTWNALRGFADIGTASLVAGTVAVANTKILATSRIRVYHKTPGANAGAVFVSVKTAGTGFTIKSTDAADDSIIYWEVISYG